jgi:hypothetical protein
MNRNLELKQRLERLQEEKNAADVRCTELKQALEEFIFSTDKRGIEEDQEDGKPLEESVDGKITLILYEGRMQACGLFIVYRPSGYSAKYFCMW